MLTINLKPKTIIKEINIYSLLIAELSTLVAGIFYTQQLF